MQLTSEQLEIIRGQYGAKVFLAGPAGAGKTTAASLRLAELLRHGVPGSAVAVLVPQKNLAGPYQAVAASLPGGAGPAVQVFTLGGLARRLVDLYWPVVAEAAGFADPLLFPVFLNLETAQYHMAGVMEPLLREGLFEGVSLDRNRLYSQVLDNLNKAAFVGFPHTEIGARLQSAWLDPHTPRQIYQDVQLCANLFRQYCLAHNLLDFSLTLEVFFSQVWLNPELAAQVLEQFTHLIVDNVEEDTPRAHDVLAAWVTAAETALLVYDTEAGYRRFLGADAESAAQLRVHCAAEVFFTGSWVMPPPVQALLARFAAQLGRADAAPNLDPADFPLAYEYFRFFPQMLDWVAEQVERLLTEDGLPPGEVVIVAPYLSDTVRFSLFTRLQERGIPVQSHRPSRSLQEEPAAQCLLTLAALAHPEWQLVPRRFEVAYALVHALSDLDLVRAQLLAEMLYRPGGASFALRPFSQAAPQVQERITYRLGAAYDALQSWLEAYAAAPEANLDYFFTRIFDELLARPGYRFREELDYARVAANLVLSAREFRTAVELAGGLPDQPTGRQHLLTVQSGLIAAQYVQDWELQRADAVLVAPAHTFLMSNRPVTVQFWLNPGSRGWWERLYQPLTHPYVLSRQWPAGQVWTDEDEVAANEEALFRLVTGLLRRCKGAVYLGLSELDEMGGELRSPFLSVLQRVLRSRA